MYINDEDTRQKINTSQVKFIQASSWDAWKSGNQGYHCVVLWANGLSPDRLQVITWMDAGNPFDFNKILS